MEWSGLDRTQNGRQPPASQRQAKGDDRPASFQRRTGTWTEPGAIVLIFEVIYEQHLSAGSRAVRGDLAIKVTREHAHNGVASRPASQPASVACQQKMLVNAGEWNPPTSRTLTGQDTPADVYVRDAFSCTTHHARVSSGNGTWQDDDDDVDGQYK